MLTAKQEMFAEARALAQCYQDAGMSAQEAHRTAANTVYWEAVKDTKQMLDAIKAGVFPMCPMEYEPGKIFSSAEEYGMECHIVEDEEEA